MSRGSASSSSCLTAKVGETPPDNGVVEPGMIGEVPFAGDDDTERFLLASRELLARRFGRDRDLLPAIPPSARPSTANGSATRRPTSTHTALPSTSRSSTPTPTRVRPLHSGSPARSTEPAAIYSLVATMMPKREKAVSSATRSPASWQRACRADRESTTLPQVTSYHWASAANRVGIVRSASSVSGYTSSKIRK